MDKLKQALMHLEAAELALRQFSEQDKDISDTHEKYSAIMHIGKAQKNVQEIIRRKAGEQV